MAFDIGHSSIGWAVLQSNTNTQTMILGCGVVTFGADDCLASKRRGYRRQRRHARSTRQRIARMEKLLENLGVFTAEYLAAKHKQAGGHPAPWLLAAQVLASNGDSKFLLDWPKLWDVLRWYAHNRGYDGNSRWTNVSEDALTASEKEEKKSDTEKEQNATKLMAHYDKDTMAETVFADIFAEFKITDPTKVLTLPYFQKHFKGNQCAFPRRIVEAEVLRILDAHKFCDAKCIHLLLAKELTDEDRAFLEQNGIFLPKRYDGGLLFGQLKPRFENRIIAECPITFAQKYQQLVAEGKTQKEAKRNAMIIAKVPVKHCREFLEFRWAMTLANIRIGFGGEKYENEAKLRPLTPEERYKVDARVRRLGFLKLEPDKPAKDGLVRPGKNELRTLVIEETKCDRHNLDTLLLHPDAREGLKLLPIKGDTTAFRVAWGCFGDPEHESDGLYHNDAMRHRFTTQLLRGTKENPKRLTIQKILDQLNYLKNFDVAERLYQSARHEAQGKKPKLDPDKLNTLLNAEFYCEKAKGRARFSRHMMREAIQQVFAKTNPVHPLEKGGCLEETEAIRRASLENPLDEQTNNHLVRHRLLILKRLHQHIIQDFAKGDKSRISQIMVEVARDLQTMSGLSNKEKAKELTGKLKHHHETAAALAEKLTNERDQNGRPFLISPGLIRKARIADDLKWKCPYTGRTFEPAFLVHRSYDKDHIIPRSKRLSDALEALVITTREINGEKKSRTSLQFIKEMNQPDNLAKRDRLGIRTEAQFREYVDSLWPKSDPFKRARAGGARVTDDEARCWRRKQLLLTETWEEKEFTPGDLTKTRYITKLAAQQLQAEHQDSPETQRPLITSITGAVTASFRDKSWKLLPLLGSANAEIIRLHQQKIEAEKAGREFNFKKALRGVTHLHHALDAITLGLIAERLIPHGEAGSAGLNGDLARLIHKGKLNAEERNQFEALRHKLRLPKFYRWATARCDTGDQRPEAAGQGGTLCIDDLPESIKQQIRDRLSEKRIIQHIPADMTGLRVEENTRGVIRVAQGRVYLRQKKRDEKSGKIVHNLTDEAVGKALGLQPSNGNGELAKVKGVRVISDNFGVAILDFSPPGQDKFVIIPHHKIWPRIYKGLDGQKSLKERNEGRVPRVLRNGQIVEIESGTYKGRWRVFSIKNKKAGLKVNLGTLDCLEVEYDTLNPETGKKCSRTTPGCKLDAALETMVAGGMRILRTRLTGTPACPTTSSA